MSEQQKTIKGPATITGIHSSGRSIAEYEGRKHYVDFGIPGEQVNFVSHRKKQGFRSGEVTNVISQSPYRIKPYCPHYYECNGCNWQHIKYEHQLNLKYKILTDALQKYNITTPEIPFVIPSPENRNYRHRIEFTFSKYNLNFSNSNSIIGYHKYEDPGNIISINECQLQNRISIDICNFIKSFAEKEKIEFYNHKNKTGILRSLSVRINKHNEILIVIGLNEDFSGKEILFESLLGNFPEIISLCWTIHISPSHSQSQCPIYSYKTVPYTFEELNSIRFRIHANSFFQPNVLQAERIFNTIREWLQLKGHEKLYDLYTGVGTIALSLAGDSGDVIGIEGSELSIMDAKENALVNNKKNTTFIAGDILETFKPGFLENYGNPDVICLDPPRSGTLIEIKKTINASGAKQVVYLSCNPVSLAFDLKQLTEVYIVKSIQSFDMIPDTHHLETLVLLERS